MSHTWHHIIPDHVSDGRIALTEHELIAWGGCLGRAVRPPLIIALAGELGAGKTTLVRAICDGCGVRDAVTSPTFTLVHQYAGASFPVYHLDLYRLAGPAELTNIGWEEIVGSNALILIEWPDRAGDRLPAQAMTIELEHLPDDPARRVLLAG